MSFNHVEGLENRLLLAAVLSAKGTLAVSGGANNDVVVVRRHPTDASLIQARINGSNSNFTLASVKRIEVYGNEGNDRLTLDDSLAIISRKGATLFGSIGDDTLVGGLAAVRFEGGAGNDNILGSSKADTMLGGNGNDTMIGGKGDDLMYGNRGDDSMLGSAGAERMYGDQNDDTLFGEAGHDTLGGDGEDNLFLSGLAEPQGFNSNDSLNGGADNDWLVGGRQSSTLDDDNGQDTLTGGPGNDILDSRGLDGSDNEDDTITDRQAGDIVPMENFSRPATAQEIIDGEDAYAVHDHADLVININDNGVQRTVIVQAGIGDFVDPAPGVTTVPSAHVHDGQEGRMHLHDLEPHVYTLGEFFRGWGVTMSKSHIGRFVTGNGRTLTYTVQKGATGQVRTILDPYQYVIDGENQFGDGDRITITYG